MKYFVKYTYILILIFCLNHILVDYGIISNFISPQLMTSHIEFLEIRNHFEHSNPEPFGHDFSFIESENNSLFLHSSIELYYYVNIFLKSNISNHIWQPPKAC